MSERENPFIIFHRGRVPITREEFERIPFSSDQRDELFKPDRFFQPGICIEVKALSPDQIDRPEVKLPLTDDLIRRIEEADQASWSRDNLGIELGGWHWEQSLDGSMVLMPGGLLDDDQSFSISTTPEDMEVSAGELNYEITPWKRPT